MASAGPQNCTGLPAGLCWKACASDPEAQCFTPTSATFRAQVANEGHFGRSVLDVVHPWKE